MLDFPGMLWYHNIRPRDKDKNKTRNEIRFAATLLFKGTLITINAH